MIPDIRIAQHIQLQDPLVGSPAQQPRLIAFGKTLLGSGETLGKIDLLGPPQKFQGLFPPGRGGQAPAQGQEGLSLDKTGEAALLIPAIQAGRQVAGLFR